MSAKAKISYPKSRLTELAARDGGIPSDIAVENATKSLESMRAKSDEKIRGAISAIEDILSAPRSAPTLNKEQMSAILRHADQIVTLSGTFCYANLDRAARSLCDVADGLLRAGMTDSKPIEVHVQTMHLLAPGSVALSDGHAAMMLGELARVAEHFNLGSLALVIDDSNDVIALAAR